MVVLHPLPDCIVDWRPAKKVLEIFVFVWVLNLFCFWNFLFNNYQPADSLVNLCLVIHPVPAFHEYIDLLLDTEPDCVHLNFVEFHCSHRLSIFLLIMDQIKFSQFRQSTGIKLILWPMANK